MLSSRLCHSSAPGLPWGVASGAWHRSASMHQRRACAHFYRAPHARHTRLRPHKTGVSNHRWHPPSLRPESGAGCRAAADARAAASAPSSPPTCLAPAMPCGRPARHAFLQASDSGPRHSRGMRTGGGAARPPGQGGFLPCRSRHSQWSHHRPRHLQPAGGPENPHLSEYAHETQARATARLAPAAGQWRLSARSAGGCHQRRSARGGHSGSYRVTHGKQVRKKTGAQPLAPRTGKN